MLPVLHFYWNLPIPYPPSGKPKRSIIFVALNAEELGLKGSSFFAENNYFDIKNSKVINFDMIGVERLSHYSYSRRSLQR